MPRLDPALRRHATGQFFVRINRVDHYLGTDPLAAQAERLRLLAARHTLATAPGPVKADVTIDELLARYLAWAPTYYRKADGTPTSEVANLRRAAKPLQRLYGPSLVADFDSVALEAIRDSMIDHSWMPPDERQSATKRGWCRSHINRNLERIKRMFHWGKRRKIVPADVWGDIEDVEGLKRGRSKAREKGDVQPAAEEAIAAVLSMLPPAPRAMVELQLLTGMRPGEVCRLRPGDIDRDGKALVRLLRGTNPALAGCWAYLPGITETPGKTAHKSGHRDDADGKAIQRVVIIGPRAQDVLRPWLEGLKPTDWIFTPARSMAVRFAERRAARKSPVTPSQRDRRKRSPARRPSEGPFSTGAYSHAITKAIACLKRAGTELDHWHPHQLRHNAATRITKEFGYTVARVVLGHRTLSATRIYVQDDLEAAFQAMGRTG